MACDNCQMDGARWSGDITTRFRLIEEGLIYYDQPLAGYLECLECRGTFIFGTRQNGKLASWYWTLVPVEGVRAENEFNSLLEQGLRSWARERGLPVISVYETRAEGGVYAFEVRIERPNDGMASS